MSFVLWLSLVFELDTEGGAFAYFAVQDVDFAFVVLFDDSFDECEAYAPAVVFGGEAGVEDVSSG